MPIYAKLPSHDQWFEEITKDSRVLVVNDIAPEISYGREDLQTMTQHIISSETMSITPSCECGFYSAMYYEGVTCPKCQTIVKPPVLETEPNIWFKRLEDMPQFINPYIWGFVNKLISSRMDAMKWLSNSSYNPAKVDPALKEVVNTIPGYTRTYVSLVTNFKEVLEILYKSNSIYKKKRKREQMELLFQIMEMYKDNIFSEYLPALPKGALIQERTGSGNYTTFVAPKQIETIIKFAKACVDETGSESVRNKAMSDLISDVTESAIRFLKVYGNGKKGYFRNDILKSRIGNSARAVIGAIVGPHDFGSIYLPWGLSISLFLPQLINIMRNRMGYTYRNATDLLLASVHNYNEEVNRALDIMLELADHDIKAILQRNPSLMQGSAIYFSIPKIKRDPTDNTINVPPPLVAVLRGDYDGDELNLILMLDFYLSSLMETFKPSNNITNESEPYKITNRLTLTKPGDLTLSNALPVKK